jgi:hypothetical protein
MPGKKKEIGSAPEEKPIVIIIGKKKCPPKRKGGFKSEAAALAWVRATHCTAPCKDAGLMVIGIDGDYEAIRFCK